MTESSWRPTASLEALKQRAQCLARVRHFFAQRGVLEVETPLLGRSGVTDLHVSSITARLAQHPGPYYLQTSPEYAMKRLLAAGAPDIYQICKAFRDEPGGRHHNPEFTLVEWYRHGFDMHALMDEVEALLTDILGRENLGVVERISYQALLQRELNIDPLTISTPALAQIAQAHLGPLPAGVGAERDSCLDLLMAALLGPQLGRDHLLFVHSYPASQAALARLSPHDARTAARFEAYLGGIELCNGFYELTDPGEQKVRFQQDQKAREHAGLPALGMDGRLLAALEHGLPECAGVALGFDRVLMLACGAVALPDVLSFPIECA